MFISSEQPFSSEVAVCVNLYLFSYIFTYTHIAPCEPMGNMSPINNVLNNKYYKIMQSNDERHSLSDDPVGDKRPANIAERTES